MMVDGAARDVAPARCRDDAAMPILTDFLIVPPRILRGQACDFCDGWRDDGRALNQVAENGDVNQ